MAYDAMQLGELLGEIKHRLDSHEARLLTLENNEDGFTSTDEEPAELDASTLQGFVGQFKQMKEMIEQAKSLGLLDQLKAVTPPKPGGS